MASSYTSIDTTKRLTGLTAMLCVHGALLLAWHWTRPMATPAPERRMEFWFVDEKKTEVETPPQARLPPALVARSSTAGRREPARPAKTPRPRAPRQSEAGAGASMTASPMSVPAIMLPIAPAPAPETPSSPLAHSERSGAELLRQARSDIGAIDRAMRKQIPKGLVRAPVSTAHQRFVKGVELANELAPPTWYEAPKIKEVIDPGGWGKKRYRIITAKGTYCLTYDSNRPSGGRDMTDGRHRPQVPTNCPQHEQPATTQP